MKKILVTRRLLRSCEDRAKEMFDANLNLNDELYSQKKLIEMSQGCDGILSALTDKLDADDVDHFIEIGPGKVLSGLVKRINREVKINTINSQEDIENLKI